MLAGTGPAGGADPHASTMPSAWVLRWLTGLPAGATVLDVACGQGRHVRWLAGHGHRVTALDRDAAALAALRRLPGAIEVVEADIEQAPWPLPQRQFDALVITNYLWRPLWPTLLASLAPGGWLVCETFNVDQAGIGKPSNPQFLLCHGELLEVARGLHIVAYEDGVLSAPERCVQRIAATRPVLPGTSAAVLLARRPLHPL